MEESKIQVVANMKIKIRTRYHDWVDVTGRVRQEYLQWKITKQMCETNTDQIWLE